MIKNKHSFPILLIMLINLFALSPLLAEDNSSSTTTDQQKRIILTEKRERPTRSLFIAPDIQAYNNNGWVTVKFNEAITGGVSIVITDEGGNVVIMDTMYPVSPMNWEFFINWDEESTYYIEIIGSSDWILTGEF